MVNYQDWDIFGTLPSTNYSFNWIPGNENILNTPFFEFGKYAGYYCLLSDGSEEITVKEPDVEIPPIEV